MCEAKTFTREVCGVSDYSASSACLTTGLLKNRAQSLERLATPKTYYAHKAALILCTTALQGSDIFQVRSTCSYGL